MSLTTCAYIGLQELKDTFGFRSQAHWWQANVMIRYKFSKKRSLSARLEYFNDPKSIFVKPITNEKGFSTYSGGLCFNVRITNNAIFRLEHRLYYSNQHVYLNRRQDPSRMGNLLITNLTVWF